ncbi:MAG: MinD superfamily P-loop ATPase containing an inserted ferredoxin domain [Anaerolineae bacterium]|jgi:MinD superfamily P-loop ATPase|nr:MAG: MinD superfamily P-loop ATPase containing an inserted ferredoxin domain [Anaerolineae bacterium]
MKQLVILSGKGGTGKTSITAAFAHLASQNGLAGKVILADADVDAANLELVLQPQLVEVQDFKGGKVAFINQDTCAACGDCERVCRFDAILPSSLLERGGESYRVDPIACDGCAACVYQCPTQSISMREQIAGKFYFSESRYGPLYHAHLFPGQENSGKLVTLVKQRARLQALDEGRELVIVDGPPGIGCPVISAVSGADLALIVAEPTISGVHDMRRILQTVQHFGVQAHVCINKADVYPAGTEEIESFCREQGIETIGRIPFDVTVTTAMVAGEAVTAFQPEAPVSVAIRQVWERVLQALAQKE